MNPLVLTLGGLVLFLAGLGLGYLMSRRPGDRQAAEELAVVREDFEAYREGVTRHFRDSAGHFQAIGEQYRALYAHMADGAKHFCASGPEQEAIEFAPQPELLSPDAESTRGPVTAAAAATALSESAGAQAGNAEAEVAERREPTLGAEEDELAEKDELTEASADDAGNPEAETEESARKAADPAESDGLEPEIGTEENPVRDVERKESRASGSGMVH